MNKFTKGILSLGLTLCILAGAAGTALADTKTGSLGGSKTYAASTISKYSAYVPPHLPVQAQFPILRHINTLNHRTLVQAL